MADPVKTETPIPATYEDLFHLPANMVGEIIAGELIAHPRPAPKHANALTNLGTRINPKFHHGEGGPGGWWILIEPELHLENDILVPDIAGWRRERLTELPETAWFDLAPDWVCEIISPGTARYDRGPKRDSYARHKVFHLWLIDPDAKTLEAFSLQKDKWQLEKTYTGKIKVDAAPFGEAPFELKKLWQ